MHAPVTGASGFIDGRLSRGLCERSDVRCLVRDGESISARALAEEGFELHVGDVLRPSSLSNVGRGVDVAYYLVHSIDRGGDGSDCAERERKAAEGFARIAKHERVARVIYLGGLAAHPLQTLT